MFPQASTISLLTLASFAMADVAGGQGGGWGGGGGGWGGGHGGHGGGGAGWGHGGGGGGGGGGYPGGPWGGGGGNGWKPGAPAPAPVPVVGPNPIPANNPGPVPCGNNPGGICCPTPMQPVQGNNGQWSCQNVGAPGTITTTIVNAGQPSVVSTVIIPANSPSPQAPQGPQPQPQPQPQGPVTTTIVQQGALPPPVPTIGSSPSLTTWTMTIPPSGQPGAPPPASGPPLTTRPNGPAVQTNAADVAHSTDFGGILAAIGAFVALFA